MPSYNGWTNYETWNVNLWIGNDEQSYRYWEKAAQEIWDESEDEEVLTKSENSKYNLSQRLEDNMMENSPLRDSPSMYSELLSSALSEVNWNEIAETLLEECENFEKSS